MQSRWRIFIMLYPATQMGEWISPGFPMIKILISCSKKSPLLDLFPKIPYSPQICSQRNFSNLSLENCRTRSQLIRSHNVSHPHVKSIWNFTSGCLKKNLVWAYKSLCAYEIEYSNIDFLFSLKVFSFLSILKLLSTELVLFPSTLKLPGGP